MKHTVPLLLSLIAAPLLAGAASTAAVDSQVGRWAVLFAAVPPPPASLAEALQGVRGTGDHYGFRLEVSDPRMLDTNRQLEDLQSKLWAPANQGLARRPVGPPTRMTIGAPLSPRNIAPPSVSLQITPTITPETATGAAPRPAQATTPELDAMMAYAQDSSFKTQEPIQTVFADLHAIRARYGAGHWQADQQAKAALRNHRDVARLSGELVRAHHALAVDQLREATVVLSKARAAMAAQVERMAELARAAEARGASTSELKQAEIFINERLAALFSFHEELLREMGLWAGVQPVKSPNSIGDLYVHAHAPNVAVVPTLALLYRGVWPYQFPTAPR